MTNKQKIAGYGQLEIGDNILIIDKNGVFYHRTVKSISGKGKEFENITTSNNENIKIYLYVINISWAKEIYKFVEETPTAVTSIEEIGDIKGLK